MLNVVPGSSHWFQLRDHVTFSGMKNFVTKIFFDFLQDMLVVCKKRRLILMVLFYQAETHAFTKEIVRSSFERVGLWPWNPKKNLEHREENSPPVSQHPEDEMKDPLIDVINVCR